MDCLYRNQSELTKLDSARADILCDQQDKCWTFRFVWDYCSHWIACILRAGPRECGRPDGMFIVRSEMRIYLISDELKSVLFDDPLIRRRVISRNFSMKKGTPNALDDRLVALPPQTKPPSNLQDPTTTPTLTTLHQQPQLRDDCSSTSIQKE